MTIKGTLINALAGTLGGAAAAGDTVTVNDANISDLGFLTTASAGIRFENNGTVDYLRSPSGDQNNQYDWVDPTSSAPGSYVIRATQTASFGTGTFTGTLNTWQALTTSRTWQVTKTTEGTFSRTLTIEISDDGGSTTLDSGSVQLSATYSSL